MSRSKFLSDNCCKNEWATTFIGICTNELAPPGHMYMDSSGRILIKNYDNTIISLEDSIAPQINEEAKKKEELNIRVKTRKVKLNFKI